MVKKKAVKKKSAKIASKKTSGRRRVDSTTERRSVVLSGLRKIGSFSKTLNPVSSLDRGFISGAVLAVAGFAYLAATKPNTVYDGPWGENSRAVYTEGSWAGNRLVIGEGNERHEFYDADGHSILWNKKIGESYAKKLWNDRVSSYTKSERGESGERLGFPVERDGSFDVFAREEIERKANDKYNEIRRKIRTIKQNRVLKKLYNIKRGIDRL